MNVINNKQSNRDRLIIAAIELMLSKGYNVTTVDEICEAAGASKGSFYHYFKTKEELGLAALDYYYTAGVKRMMSGAFMKESNPKKRLMGFLKQVEQRSLEFWENGCLLGSFAVDLAETNPRIRQSVADSFEGLADRLSVLFKPLTKGANDEAGAKDIALHYLAVLEGGIVMARAFDDPGRIRDTLKAYRKQLNITVKSA